jgi:nicotinate phosphoribosyltransferase
MSIRWDGLSAISCRSLLVVTDRLTADSSSPLAVSPSRRLAVYPADHVAVGLGTVASGTVGGVLGAVYKLVWYEGAGDPARIKLAGEKSTWPGRKQVYRIGAFEEDVIQLDDELTPSDGTPLLHPAIGHGEIVVDFPPVPEIQARAMANVDALPQRYRTLHDLPPYPVRRSRQVRQLRERISQSVRRQDASR